MITLSNVAQNLRFQNTINYANYVIKQSSQRLSTGYKINSASDSPADFYIASNLTTAIRGTEVANQNAMNAKSYLTIADETVVTMLDCVFAMKDFATQALNTTSASEREALLATAQSFLAQMYSLESSAKYGDSTLFIEEGIDETHKTKEELDELYGEGNWVEVDSADELQAIATSDLSKTYVLTSDIDLSSIENFTAIGTNSSKFTGTFDGNGYTISNLTIDKEGESYQGLFGYTNNATIKDVKLVNANVKGYDETGGLVGYGQYGTIANCSVDGTVKGYGYTGGLAGRLSGVNIVNSSSSGYIESEDTAGGLIGCTSVTTGDDCIITNCHSTANVKNSSGVTGGLIGNANKAIITNCYATGNVEGQEYVGGLVGGPRADKCTVTNSYATGNVKGTSNVGGLVGGGSGSSVVQNSYFLGQVTGTSSTTGALVGETDTTVTNSHYVKQNNGCGGEGTEHEASWFENRENQKSVLGDSGAWDFTFAKPKLMSETGNNKVKDTIFQVGYDTSETSKMLAQMALNISGLELDFSSDEKIKESLLSLEGVEEKLEAKSTYLAAKNSIVDNIISYQELSYTNMVEARSNIIDTNTADEMLRYTQAAIIAETATALMQQCNSLNANLVLRLIGAA